MKRLFLIKILLIVLGINYTAKGKENALQITTNETYAAYLWEELDSITFDVTENHFMLNKKTSDIERYSYIDGLHIPISHTLPLINITTNDGLDITSKTDYSEGVYDLKCFGEYEDVNKEVNIRGRGNSSWGFPKKPYRLKFNKKISLCGLPAAKNYVLLASYTDHSFTQFALAIKMADMLGLEYTNHIIPVELNLNGNYLGIYLLTNKPGINAGSVDIDEDSSIMWELDVNYDEDYKFISPIFELPVNLADPDLDDEGFEYWKEDFIAMEEAVLRGEANEVIDMDVFARYLLIYDILRNGEIGHPKSVKLYKTEGGKYIFGPIWDFDFAMGAIWGTPYTTYNLDEALKGLAWRNKLFLSLETDEVYKAARIKYWNIMRDKLPELLEYIDEFSSWVRLGAERNNAQWEAFEDFDECIKRMKNWLEVRYEWCQYNIK